MKIRFLLLLLNYIILYNIKKKEEDFIVYKLLSP